MDKEVHQVHLVFSIVHQLNQNGVDGIFIAMPKLSSFLSGRYEALFCDADVNAQGISHCQVDTRLLQPGDLFFALPGERVDGHQFLGEAKKKGARAAVASTSFQGEAPLPLIRVDDVLRFLQDLSAQALAWTDPKEVVAVTGSYGKSTTKTFLHAFLATAYKTAATPKNYNSQIGLPLTLLNHVDGDEEVVLLEMGMTLSGHIQRLTEIAPPTRAIVTAVDDVHAGNFTGLEGIAQAKGEVFSHPDTRCGWVCYDSPCRDLLEGSGGCPKKTFSVNNSGADLSYVPHPTSLIVEWEGERADLGSNEAIYPIKHNLIAAAAMALEMGIPLQKIAHAAKEVQPPERRFQHIEVKGVKIISDCINASGMRFALENMPEGKRKIAVLGHIPDQGGASPQLHREIGRLAMDRADLLFCVGEEAVPMAEEWKREHRPAQHFTTVEQLTEELKKVMEEGDVILVKGAMRLEMWKLVEEITS